MIRHYRHFHQGEKSFASLGAKSKHPYSHGTPTTGVPNNLARGIPCNPAK